MFFRCRSFRHGLTDASDHHARTQVQQLASFTMHTGLAEQLFTCLRGFSAFPTCYFPLCVSALGRLDVLEVLTPFLSRVTREFHMHRHGAPSPPVHLAPVQTPEEERWLASCAPCASVRRTCAHSTRFLHTLRPAVTQRVCAQCSVAS